MSTIEAIPYLDRADIEKKAADLLRRLNISEPPISAAEIAYGLHIPILPRDFDDGAIAGKLVKRGFFFEIHVRADDPDVRTNFTIAHEIGHRSLHPFREWSDDEVTMYRRDYRSEDTGVNRAEWQANAFAAALLMPEAHVREKWELLKSPTYLLPLFKVSKPAMLRRLEELGLIAPTIEGFRYLDMEKVGEITPPPRSAPLHDEHGEIPTFPPVAVDQKGKIIPLAEDERRARQTALSRILGVASHPDRVDSPDLEERFNREFDQERPHRRLFDDRGGR